MDTAKYIDYRVENHVHRFVMLEASRDAMNAYFDLLQEIMESLNDGEPFLAIFDATQSGFPAVGPTIKRGATIANTYGRSRTMRTLVVQNSPTIANIAKPCFEPCGFSMRALYRRMKWNPRWIGCLKTQVNILI